MDVMSGLAFGLMVVLLVTAFVQDVTQTKISNKLTLPFMGLGLVAAFIHEGIPGVMQAMVSMVVLFVILFVLFLIGAVGAGDVKLFAAIGAIGGMELSLLGLLYSILYAGVIGLLIWTLRHTLGAQLKRIYHFIWTAIVLKSRKVWHTASSQTSHFPFMWAVLPGMTTAYFMLV
ncbi:A24 family peptidase [Marinicrinis sediminis]|uniref:Prepilin peptidase n=1 Tax=Marinicrinis sediminis TaxID=1652465 RepID=A0ABW5REF4_9BACL